MDRWNTRAYQRIVGVKVEGVHLRVQFSNGDTVRVKAQELVPKGVHLLRPLPKEIAYDTFELRLPTVGGEDWIVPWNTLRLITDLEFADHWDQSARADREFVGNQLRAWRIERGLKPKGVGLAVGMYTRQVNEVENGERELDYPHLMRYLSAVGHTLSELAVKRSKGAR